MVDATRKPAPPPSKVAMQQANAATPLRVLLVDDSPWLRQSVREGLERAGLAVVGEAADGAQALTQAVEQDPDVVLMDLCMPGMDGVEATRRIVAKDAEAIVLMLSACGEESLVIEALMAGARGYLPKDAPAAELADAIYGVATGQARIAGQVTRPLLDKLVEALGRERETRQTVEEAHRASEHLRRRQERLATVAAHELRTPVTALLGSLATLERLCSPDRLRPQELELLTASTRQARRFARLVEDFMVAATEASDGISVNPTRVEVEPVVKSVVADLDHLGAERVRISAAPGLRAWADPDRLAQVLTNLIRNALQYAPSASPVEVVASSGPAVVQITVNDRGPGIPPDKLPQLFDRFGERPSGQTGGGLGVGLWIVRELVTAMHGNVWVEHDWGGGSSFCIAIPAAPGD
jgi:signal transduction histidine kinase